MKWKFWKKSALTKSQQILQDEKNVVDIRRIGLNALTLGQSIDERSLQEAAMKYSVAQAKLDKIAKDESGLVAREIFPHIDFFGDDMRSANPNWSTKEYRLRPTYYKWFNLVTDKEVRHKRDNWDRHRIDVFHTHNISSGFNLNTRRIICIYGAELIAPTLHASAVEFHRGNVKVISIYDLTQLINSRKMLFATPILFKRSDYAKIVYRIGDDAIGKTDCIRFNGVVVESLGDTMVG